jgi:hypothetical protein
MTERTIVGHERKMNNIRDDLCEQIKNGTIMDHIFKFRTIWVEFIREHLNHPIDAILLDRIAAIYLLSATVFMVPSAKIADIYDMNMIFFIGLAIFFGTGTAILARVFPLQGQGSVSQNQCHLCLTWASLGVIKQFLLRQDRLK